MAVRDFIREDIVNHNSIGDLNLANAGIRDSEIPDIVTLINQNPNIIAVNFSFNNISKLSTQYLLQLINVKYLNLSQTDIDDDSAIALISSSKFNFIDFSRNRNISDVTGDKILILKYCKNLNLERTAISKETLKIFNNLILQRDATSRKPTFFESLQKREENANEEKDIAKNSNPRQNGYNI